MAKYQLIIANHHELSSICLAGHQKKGFICEAIQ